MRAVGATSRTTAAARALDVGAHGREGRRQGHGLVALVAEVRGDGAERILVQRRVFLAGVEGAAADHVDLRRDRLQEVPRPARERRDPVALGQRDPDRGHPRQVAALHEGVHELGGAHHHRLDVRPGLAGRLQQPRDRLGDAVAHVGSGEGLGGCDHLAPRHQDGVGVGASDVHAEAEPRSGHRCSPAAPGVGLRLPADQALIAAGGRPQTAGRRVAACGVTGRPGQEGGGASGAGVTCVRAPRRRPPCGCSRRAW